MRNVCNCQAAFCTVETLIQGLLGLCVYGRPTELGRGRVLLYKPDQNAELGHGRLLLYKPDQNAARGPRAPR